MKLNVLSSLIAAAVLSTAVASQVYAQDIVVSQEARDIAKNSLIIDTHVDAPWRLMNDWEDLTQAAQRGDFDYERARQGGLDAPFMAIYIPSSYEKKGAYTLANHLIDFVESMVYRAPDKVAIPHSADELEQQFAAGLMSLPLGIENGAPIEGKLENLQHFYQRGVRYMTLTHSEDNHIADSSYDTRNTWQGLSPFGKEVVAEMNRIGMMVDISHVSDLAFYDAIKVSKTPVIATHSSVRHFTPGFQRNMNDDMIKALAKNGGVIQITFGSSFVKKEANQYRAHLQTLTNEINTRLGEGTPAAQAAISKMRAANPYPFAHVNDVLDHIDHVVRLVGIEHVGLGSDYDGVGDSLPVGLKDVSAFPTLIQGLLNRGYNKQQIDLILHGNTLRVWRAVEAFAAQQ